jgi:hypothetical protein
MRIAPALPLVTELSIVVQLEVIFEFVAVQTKELGAGGGAGVGVAVGLLPPDPPVVAVGLPLPPPELPPVLAVGLPPPLPLLPLPLVVAVGSPDWPPVLVALVPAVVEHALSVSATPSTNTKLIHTALLEPCLECSCSGRCMMPPLPVLLQQLRAAPVQVHRSTGL